MAKTPPLPVYHLVKVEKAWRLKSDTGRAKAVFATKDLATKGGALEKAIGKEGDSVRIYKADGKLQEERTFPGGRDPSSSKG